MSSNVLRKSLVLGVVLVLAPLARARADEGSGVRAPGGLMDSGNKKRPMQVSGYALVPYWGRWGVGVAGRFTIPIVHNGFIPKLNDSVELEFGPDFYWATWWFGPFGNVGTFHFAFPIEARWTFHITPEFSAYGKVGIGPELIFTSTGVAFWPYPQGGIGLLYKLSEGLYLRGELSNGARIGVGLDL